MSIALIHPHQKAELSDDEVIALYRPTDRSIPRVRANFVASVDGAATASGLSGALGSTADKRVFDLLRRLCDVVLVGAGTVRNEGYGAMRLDDSDVLWRVGQGMPEHPVFAIVSASLRLDPTSDVFAKAPVRPIVITSADADRGRRESLEQVADVLVCGDTAVDPARMVAALVERGLTQIHSEGGPTLLGDLVAADLLDELCLSVSPILEGGVAGRIVVHPTAVALRRLTLDHVLLADGMLLTRYSRAAA